MGKMVIIDEETCIGCESCVEIAPSTFSFNESTSKAYVTDPDASSEEDVQEAIDTCPVQCISWEE
ncbi:4Fe-4S ferredoxin iron-sulfur binding domain-containing protein [Desulfovibrio sp. X2]|uniref:ferredoxin n=1 Tax=Desulfovibrio sp. X2 TaxID=941449 RepID=UPI0003588A31|nr:ferredoxin [Desulfovibrio sp. X2]EPR37491.1 4Fe-4S ferredoxin iron-sulfur binding domain-containing protein [Desulfovibrio sp. X2]